MFRGIRIYISMLKFYVMYLSNGLELTVGTWEFKSVISGVFAMMLKWSSTMNEGIILCRLITLYPCPEIGVHNLWWFVFEIIMIQDEICSFIHKKVEYLPKYMWVGSGLVLCKEALGGAPQIPRFKKKKIKLEQCIYIWEVQMCERNPLTELVFLFEGICTCNNGKTLSPGMNGCQTPKATPVVSPHFPATPVSQPQTPGVGGASTPSSTHPRSLLNTSKQGKNFFYFID